jgi:hypothetical protein
MSFNCQSSFGPPAGHCLRRPLSCDTPSRAGPRHWGQSEVEAAVLADLVTNTAEKHKQSAATVVSNRNFTVFSLLTVVIASGVAPYTNNDQPHETLTPESSP